MDNNYAVNRNNKYRPLKGELRNTALKIKKELDQIKDFDNPTTTCIQINIDHLIEGVRCNGISWLIGFIDVYNGLKDYKNGLIEVEKNIKEVREFIINIEKIFIDFRVCPECDGVKGKYTGVNYWEDCDSCRGLGMIRKDLPKRFKLIKER